MPLNHHDISAERLADLLGRNLARPLCKTSRYLIECHVIQHMPEGSAEGDADRVSTELWRLIQVHCREPNAGEQLELF